MSVPFGSLHEGAVERMRGRGSSGTMQAMPLASRSEGNGGSKPPPYFVKRAVPYLPLRHGFAVPPLLKRRGKGVRGLAPPLGELAFAQQMTERAYVSTSSDLALLGHLPLKGQA